VSLELGAVLEPDVEQTALLGVLEDRQEVLSIAHGEEVTPRP
jgi:hypothetical protein